MISTEFVIDKLKNLKKIKEILNQQKLVPCSFFIVLYIETQLKISFFGLQ